MKIGDSVGIPVREGFTPLCSLMRFLAIIALLLAAQAAWALTVTADITTDTTWTSSDSPVIINPAGSSGGTITVRNGATLTIDSSGGAVIVRWNENCDFRIGDGTEDGTLHLEAAGNAITFEVRTGGNINVSPTGQILCTDTTSPVNFTRFSTNTWGALDFEAGQTRRSELKNCTFSFGGNDSGAHNGIIHIRDSGDNMPRLENISFDTCTGSAIRMDGEGIQLLEPGNLFGPISVANTTYAFNLQTTVSTANEIRFPDIEGTTAPLAQFTGNQTIGSSTAISHWRFDDAWEFVEVTGTPAIIIVQGSIWGTAEKRPVFRTTSGTGKAAWTGIQVTTDSYPNIFGGIGPLSFVEVRNASVGIDIDKGTTYTPDAAGATPWKFPGLVARMCGIGIRVRTALAGSAPFEGYTTIIDGANLGGTTTSGDCTTCIQVEHGRAIIQSCVIDGAVTANIGIGNGATVPNDVTIRECRLSDAAATHSINLGNCAAPSSVTIERTSIFTATTGITFAQTSGDSNRSLTVRNSCITALTTCVSLNVTTASVVSMLFEDCTIGGTSSGSVQRGILATSMGSSSSALWRRCNVVNCVDYGFITGTGTGNTCEYTFEECAFLENGDGGTGRGGISDSRGNGARVVAVHCTFQGNNPWGVFDNQASAAALAENCYWGASDGPGGAGPGSGNAINSATNVDASPFLAGPYFAELLGGSPASASEWNVQEDATTPADALHVIAADPYFAWVFASDFTGETQSAYQIQVSANADFSGTHKWDTSKTGSTSATYHQYAGSTLDPGTTYHARIALWNQSDRRGPWHVLVFRMNGGPGTIDDTDREPGVEPPTTPPVVKDATPELIFRAPADGNSDPLHFQIELDTADTFDTGNLRSLDTSAILGAGGLAEYSTDDGTTWLPLPHSGVPADIGALIRVTCPHEYPNSLGVLTDTDWFWRVRASDTFAAGAWSTAFVFEVAREYTFSGTVTGASDIGFVIYKAPSTLIASGSSVTSTFSITTSSSLNVNDRIVIGVAGTTTGGADYVAGYVTNFTGGDMSALNMAAGELVIDPRTSQSVNLDHFVCDDGIDALIPWSETSAAVDLSGLSVSAKGTWFSNHSATCTSLSIALEGRLIVVSGFTIQANRVSNSGSIEVCSGAQLYLASTGSVGESSGRLGIYGTLTIGSTGSATYWVIGGVIECRGATLESGGSFVSTLQIDSDVGTAGIADITGCVFSKVKFTVASGGVVDAFNDNTFQDGAAGEHILWQCENPQSVVVFRGVQFNYTCALCANFYNASASASARVLTLIGGGGPRNGEAFDNPTNDAKVLFEFMPPVDVQATAGDTRIRLEWADDPQADPSGAGYNIYRTTAPNDAPPWGSPINGGSPVTDTFYNDTSLTNGTTYYYYVTCAGSGVGTESAGSARVSAKPAAPSFNTVVPGFLTADGVFALTAIGAATHWVQDVNQDVDITHGGTGTITVNDFLVISPTLILIDVTTDALDAVSANVQIDADDVWGISGYDESITTTIAVNSNPSDLIPAVSFVDPSADADTATAFDIELSFSANGGADVDDATFEFFASRVVSHDNADRDPGTNLATGATDIFDTITASGAEASIEGSAGAGDQKFYDGEYILSARVANVDGKYSHWARRRIYVNGASGDLIKVPDGAGGVPVKLLQGKTQTITIAGSGLSGTPDFGADIEIISTSGSGATMDVTVYVENLAAAGPRTITTNSGAKAGIATVAYPTELLPQVNNEEPSRNPAIGGMNVFLVNGEFFKAETDIAVRGRMMGVSWSRFYRSQITYNGPLGQNWIGHYYQRVTVNSGATDIITWYTPDGRSEEFEIDGSDYTSPAGIYVKPEWVGDNMSLLDRHGYRCVFDNEGRLWKCIDRNGNFTECEYNFAGQLVRIYNDRRDAFDITYHDHGRVLKFIDDLWDPDEREVEYDYNANGDLVSQFAPETSRYSGAGRITYGYRYDNQHRLTECINPREFAESQNPASYMENQYDAQGRVVAQRLGGQDQWLYLRYTTTTGLVRELDRRKLLTEYSLDAEGRVERIERFTGFFDVDRDAPIDHDDLTGPSAQVRASDPTSFATELTYNADHEVETITSPRAIADSFGNATTEYTYDDSSMNRLAHGNVLGVRQVDYQGVESDLVTTYTYEDNYQFVKTVTNPRGNLTTYVYDYEETDEPDDIAAANLVRVTSPVLNSGTAAGSSNVTRTTYNEFGQPLTMIDAEGNVTRFVYYSTGATNGYLKQRITDWGGLNLTSEFDYDNVGNLTASWPPRAFESGSKDDSFKSTFVVNELNQTWHVTGPRLYEFSAGARAEAYSYFDPNGNLTHSFREYVTDAGTQPNQPGDADDPATFEKASTAMAATWAETSYTYDLLNRRATSTVDAVAGSAITRLTSSVEYDANDNVVRTYSPLGNSSFTVYDERDMVFRRVSGYASDVAATFETDYDDDGNVIASRDALGNESTYVIDGFGRVTRANDALGHYRTTAYNENGNAVLSQAFTNADTLLAATTIQYDEIDRAIQTDRLALDHRGNPIGDGFSTNTTVFDRNSRVARSTNDNGVTYHNFYDGANRTMYTRDAVGNETHFVYNLNGAVTRVNYREINGLNNAVEISHEETIYDFMDRALTFRDRRYGTGFDTSVTMNYDGWSRVTERTDAAGTTVIYTYDLLSRTTHTEEETGSDEIFTRFEYDDDSRVTTRAIQRNPGAATWQETTYEYDERSRLTTLRRPDAATTGDIWTYKYDANSNLIEWADPLGTRVVNTYDVRNLIAFRHIDRGTGIVGATDEHYAFDALGRLVSCGNHDDGKLISASAWAYNTLSAPERHDQTVADYEGNVVTSRTTYSEYDATTFKTATVYSSGRKVVHTPDGLNRLLNSYDTTHNINIATYIYAGPRRIVERSYGNGTRTNYHWEASGCGCGGSTSFCERVEHVGLSDNRVMWATNRRHDVRGLVTVESRDHEGGMGSVYRYDDAERLVETYMGVNLAGTELNVYADQAESLETNTKPWGLRRSYELDPRGNRGGVVDHDGVNPSSPGLVYDYSYTAHADTNQYTAVDGANYTFDAIEQMTHDPARGLYMAYDYRGQLWLEDDDSNFATPERRYSYDNQGRLRYEGRFYEASYHTEETVISLYCPECSCGCQNPGHMISELLSFDGSGDESYSVEASDGVGVHGSLSSNAQHPQAVLPSGGSHEGNNRVLVKIIDHTVPGQFKLLWIYEDQLGSTIGRAGTNGLKYDEYGYLDYGRPIRRGVAAEFLAADWFDLGSPMTGVTRIWLHEPPPGLIGHALAVATPEDGFDNHWNVGAIVDVGVDLHPFEGVKGFIDVNDADELISSALAENECGFVVYDHHDTNIGPASHHTYGAWTDAPVEDSGFTTFYDGAAGSEIKDFMVGWLLVPDVHQLAYLEIVAVGDGEITVKGNAENMAAEGTQFWLVAPTGVSATHGALETDPCAMDNPWLWANYHYRPPVAGFSDPEGQDPGIYGKQPGQNQAGTYDCWNRVYEPSTGRWTTPDPAMSPWTNTLEYADQLPTSSTDPSGLGIVEDWDKSDELWAKYVECRDNCGSNQGCIDACTKKYYDRAIDLKKKAIDSGWSAKKQEEWKANPWKGAAGGAMADSASDYCSSYDRESRQKRQLAWLACALQDASIPEIRKLYVDCEVLEQLQPGIFDDLFNMYKKRVCKQAQDMADAAAEAAADMLKGINIKKGKIEMKGSVQGLKKGGKGGSAAAGRHYRDVYDALNNCLHMVKGYLGTLREKGKAKGCSDCDQYLCPSDYS
ncbi:MAG: hypothetical protein KF696_01340 [Planctomycetes bacterium]|nr:hypothetical protein [Planctomycetota bacterium]MCW8134416.1 hypothetical protein [Planctomycetota bacterium]